MTRWEPLSDAEAAVFEAAMRAQLGQPWRHRGRKGCGYGHQTGYDCIGLAVYAALQAGRHVEDVADYGHDPDGQLLTRISAHLGPAQHGTPPAGRTRLLCVIEWTPGVPRHVIYVSSAGTVIHAHRPDRTRDGRKVAGVLEHGMPPDWPARIVHWWPL